MTRWSLPEPGRNQRQAAVAAQSAVREIDQNDEQQLEALVAAFLCAAWPTPLAQNQ